MQLTSAISSVICNISAVCTALIVVCLMPWYGIAHSFFGTRTHEYAWVVSAAFLSGLTPAVTGLVLYGVFMSALVVFSASLVRRKDDRERQRAQSSSPRVRPASVSLAPVVVPIPVWQRRLIYLAFFVTIHMFMALVNNVVIPCLVVAAQSPSCFNELFFKPKSIDTNYLVPGCAVDYQSTTKTYVTVCSYQDAAELTLSYKPLFTYDYQCSSSFITDYAPAFVYMGLVAGVGLPLAKVVALRLLQRATPGTRWRSFLATVVPRILKPIKSAKPEPPSGGADAYGARARAFHRIRRGRYFDANNQISTLITYLGILLTFGVVFPPLAVVMCATIWSVDWQTRIVIGRFMHNAKEVGALHLLECIEQGYYLREEPAPCAVSDCVHLLLFLRAVPV
jgi:hypothetical protein